MFRKKSYFLMNFMVCKCLRTNQDVTMKTKCFKCLFLNFWIFDFWHFENLRFLEIWNFEHYMFWRFRRHVFKINPTKMDFRLLDYFKNYQKCWTNVWCKSCFWKRFRPPFVDLLNANCSIHLCDILNLTDRQKVA